MAIVTHYPQPPGGSRSLQETGGIGRCCRCARRLSNVRLAINDSINLRRHRNACEHYREKWNIENALYQCYCLRDTPPLTLEEQERCFASKRGCWRDRKARRYATT